MMARNQDEEDIRRAADEKPLEKKPYKKPSYRYERVFVTSALSCGKVTTTQASCTMNRKLS
jgi:hypothetical protein